MLPDGAAVQRADKGLDRRTFLRAGASVAGAAILTAACGGGSGASGPARKTIRIWDAYPKDYPSAKVMQGQVWSAFLAKHPGFKLEYTAGLDPTQIASRFANASLVNQEPDIFYNYASKGDLWLAGYLQPVESILSDLGIDDDFYPGALRIWSIEGHLYGIPTWYGTKCYAYRTDLLKKAGLNPDNLPAGWSDFAQMAGACAIRKGNHFTQDGYLYYATDDKAASSERLVTHIRQNGGTEFIGNQVTGKSGLREPAAIEAFTWFMDLIREHHCQSPDGPVAPNEPSELGKGLDAIEYMGPWTVPALGAAYPGCLDKITIGNNLTAQSLVSLGNAGAWSLNKKSDLLPEATDLMKILLKDKNYAAYNQDAKYPSARKSINARPDFWMAQYPLVNKGPYAENLDSGSDVDNWHLGYSQIYSQAYATLIEKGVNRVGNDKDLMNQAADAIDAITKQSLSALPGGAASGG
ncbi:MAG TPA: extracellular solute-binding protein [Streptosporangiaceae bacterium]|jgi:ABC-type glycerol-3-phosphate transport system substrate-binding protein